MKLADLATGSDWIVWIVFVIFAVLSIILLSGHGSWFISGYNTASREEKEKYDEKKLCRTMGIGMSIIAILALTMGLFENILPAFFVYIALGIILVDVVVINSRLLIYKNLTNPFICRIFLLFINYTILSICNDILMVLNDNAF